MKNAFGILVQHFKAYDRQFSFILENVDHVVKVTIVLHSYLHGKKGLNEIAVLLNPDNDLFMAQQGALQPLSKTTLSLQTRVFATTRHYQRILYAARRGSPLAG